MNIVGYDIADIPDSEVEWLWYGYLAKRNLTLLSGAPKAGKSTLLFDFLKQMKDNKPCLGLSTTCAPTVLVTEESLQLVKARSKSLGLLSAPLHVLPLQPGLSWPMVIAYTKNLIVHNNYGLVIIDTVARFWDAYDENDGRQCKNC